MTLQNTYISIEREHICGRILHLIYGNTMVQSMDAHSTFMYKAIYKVTRQMRLARPKKWQCLYKCISDDVISPGPTAAGRKFLRSLDTANVIMVDRASASSPWQCESHSWRISNAPQLPDLCVVR